MKIEKGFPSTTMDDYQLNLSAIIRHAARIFPEREIVSRTPQGIFRYTYSAAHNRMKKLANALGNLGVQPGERIGVLSWNTYRHYELYFAIPGTGAVLLQMNLRISPQELIYVANHSTAGFIFVDESLLPLAERIAPELKTVRGYIIITDQKLDALETSLKPVYSYEDLLAEASEDYDWPMIDEKSAYSACYTSGTTGRPKGVYYSHRAIYLHTMAKAFYLGLSSDDVFLGLVPMFHAQGWGSHFSATFAGAKIVFPGRYETKDLGSLVDLMIQEKVTYANGAPAVFLPMLEYVKELKEKPDLRGARFECGATEPPIAMMKGWQELTGANFIHAYGATETTPLVTVNFLKPPLEETLSAEEKWELKRKQGLVIQGVDLKVVDAGGKEVASNGEEAGEILIRGPWVAKSYYDDLRTEESFVDGYWKSSDAATIDSHGYLKIVDRYKDLIKSGGEWISSVDLENAIMAHPAVREATVIGLPHPKWEERPLALVVPTEGATGKITKEEIIEFICPRFAKWQLPDDILFVEEIPKTSVGKFNKKIIREKYQEFFQENQSNV